jgi:hypothetical protein
MEVVAQASIFGRIKHLFATNATWPGVAGEVQIDPAVPPRAPPYDRRLMTKL